MSSVTRMVGKSMVWRLSTQTAKDGGRDTYSYAGHKNRGSLRTSTARTKNFVVSFSYLGKMSRQDTYGVVVESR